MYIGIPACIYRFTMYNVVMEKEKPKERRTTMNTAYKNFLNDALYDYCKANGIDLGDLIDHIEFHADHPFTVSDGNGGKRTVSEPNAYEYSDAEGTYIITSLDSDSLACEDVDVEKLEKAFPGAVDKVLSNWCDELQNEINNASYDVLDWQTNLETACSNAGIDIEDVLCD